MRILTSAAVCIIFWGTMSTASALDACDVVKGVIVCDARGGFSPRPGPEPGPGSGVAAPIRYLHTTTDPGVGDCWFWSSLPGGLDAWDPANDPAIIFTIGPLPACPGTPPGPILSAAAVEVLAWRIFRAFPLTAPLPSFEPDSVGITGLPTFMSIVPPAEISHAEILPDGRSLQVRARLTDVSVDWGDGWVTDHRPSSVTGYPHGEAQHTYELKTCPTDYRASHPGGGNCHPTLDHYTVETGFGWFGQYSLGGGWINLGEIAQTASTTYDVDEVVGVLNP